MKKRTVKPPKLVEIANPTVIVTIRAEIPLGQGGEEDEGAEGSIEAALDELRGYGTADVISRKVVGTPVAGKKR